MHKTRYRKKIAQEPEAVYVHDIEGLKAAEEARGDRIARGPGEGDTANRYALDAVVPAQLATRIRIDPIEGYDLGIDAFKTLLLDQGEDERLQLALSRMKLADNVGNTHKTNPFESSDEEDRPR
jgi:hypothetical protein